MKHKVAIITSTRAEYGLLSDLISQVEKSSKLELQLFITGSHLLSTEQELFNEINEKHNITSQVKILNEQTNSNLEIALATSKALAGFAEQFSKHKPDIVVVLGDRYELLAICSAALLSHIPIAHIHGGEVTQGAMDESIRHAVTKLSNLHFVAAESYRQRVLQMGEQPDKVYLVGSVGLDLINKIDFLDKKKLENELGFSLVGKIILLTYHPVSWGTIMATRVLNKLFNTLENLIDCTIIWTGANADATGHELNQTIKKWIKNKDNIYFVQTLGSQKYLSLMKLADLVLGNSSSGIIEAPALGIPTVNIGNRQTGRLKANSIIDCGQTQIEIEQAITKSFTEEFKRQAKQSISLYEAGEVTKKIVKQLELFLNSPDKNNLQKTFNNLDRLI